MSQSEHHHEIGILAYPGVQLAAVYGLVDLFETADRLHGERGGDRTRLTASRWDGSQVPSTPLTAVILPPSLQGDVPDDRTAILAAWIDDRHRDGALLCSVCAGAFLLAHTGKLAGRPATTHWALADRFAERFPDITLEPEKLVVDDGDIITAGGLMAWVDLGLRLIERFLGPATTAATARFFLVDPADREQRFYSRFSPRLTHGDRAVLKAQQWLQAGTGDAVTVPMMAEQAGLGERTFLRRFQKATGLRPTDYLRQLRVGKAQELLELSTDPVDRIAWRVGYEDASAFRKVFHRLVGLTPGAYRRRFTVVTLR